MSVRDLAQLGHRLRLAAGEPRRIHRACHRTGVDRVDVLFRETFAKEARLPPAFVAERCVDRAREPIFG
jgi:hypothetical protein